MIFESLDSVNEAIKEYTTKLKGDVDAVKRTPEYIEYAIVAKKLHEIENKIAYSHEMLSDQTDKKIKKSSFNKEERHSFYKGKLKEAEFASLETQANFEASHKKLIVRIFNDFSKDNIEYAIAVYMSVTKGDEHIRELNNLGNGRSTFVQGTVKGR